MTNLGKKFHGKYFKDAAFKQIHTSKDFVLKITALYDMITTTKGLQDLSNQ